MSKDLFVTTYNVDFGADADAVRRRVKRLLLDADAVVLQETKNVNLRELLADRKKYGVIQFKKSKATAGCAIVWRKDSGLEIQDRGRFLGTRNLGRKMLDRYIVWGRFTYDNGETRRPIILVSAHFPPKRYWAVLYDLMLRSLTRFVSSRKKPVLVGADWNRNIRLSPVLNRVTGELDGQKAGYGIDGWILVPKNRWTLVGVKKFEPFGGHGHPPIRVRLNPEKRK